MEPKRGTNIRRGAKERRYYVLDVADERRELPRRSLEERRKEPVTPKVPEPAQVKKILVTGDREWDDVPRVVEELQVYAPGTVVVHGACRGADNVCAAVAEALGFIVRGYPADWNRYRKGAGPVRNQQMLDMEHWLNGPIDVCLAFHNHIEDSKGTADMVHRASKAHIPVVINMSRSCSSAD